ncbi:MAG: sensor domain-containing diguanylate cyclase, partial [Candidatus Neomarinimicrobiota bacterium]|nr:sensor domain-containing diguanylate cyclase [Candidatus Neomarinimicrobiota bacterium]
GSIFTVVKIFVFISVLVLLYQFNIDPSTKKDRSINVVGNIPNTNNINKELEENYDSLLELIFNMIISLNPDYKCATYMLSTNLNTMVLQKSTSNDFPDRIVQDNPLIVKIINLDTPSLIQQNEEKNAWTNLFGDKSWRGSECMMGIRLKYNDHLGGCLLLMADHFKSINDRDKNILSYLGKYLSAGISKLQRIEKLLGDKDFRIRISRLFNQLNISSKENELLDEVKELCRAYLRYDKLTITFPKSNSSAATVKMIDGFNEDSKLGDIIEIDNTLHGLPYKLGETINSSNWIEKYPVKGRFIQGDIQQYNFNSILSIPIRYDNNILGAISIERLEESIFSSKDIQFLELLADTMGSILAWKNEYLKMYKSAIHDGLTDLLNHKAYKERLAEELSRAKRFKQSLVLLILDLDKFKRINDTYGHLYGDYVLSEISKILKDSVRNIDICARYGGEEFAIVLVNTDVENAQPVAERIIEKVSEFHFNKDGIEERMTISAGMSEYPMHSIEMKELIAHADLAMYEVKKNGGNSIIAHGDY